MIPGYLQPSIAAIFAARSQLKAKAVQLVNLEHKNVPMLFWEWRPTRCIYTTAANLTNRCNGEKPDSSIKPVIYGVFPNGKGYALATIDGRGSREYFDVSAGVQARKYAFKC